jgi:hypothetical protein
MLELPTRRSFRESAPHRGCVLLAPQEGEPSPLLALLGREKRTLRVVDGPRREPRERLQASRVPVNGHLVTSGTFDKGACRPDVCCPESMIAHNSLIRNRLPSTTLLGEEPKMAVAPFRAACARKGPSLM